MARFISCASCAILLLSSPSNAQNFIKNGSFEKAQISGKELFRSQVEIWVSGNGLTFIAPPGSGDDGNWISLYGPFARTSPDGGNFVIADGDPAYATPIQQTVTGLTIGGLYELNFFQAAGQQSGFRGDTTSRWRVSFGDDLAYSNMISLPVGGHSGWQQQTMRFKASAISQILSFLAIGTPAGGPPMALLDGVSLSAVPEPSSWAMMISGLAVVGGALRARRRDRRTAALV